MNELSKVLGISRPTLSRYFQDPSKVRRSTVHKIEAGLEEVDYVYNFIATRQNRASSGLIGVVIPHYEDLYYASLLASIEDFAASAGFTVLTQCSNGCAEGEAQTIARLRSMSVDGAIVVPMGLGDSSDDFRRAIEDFPIVFADSRPAEPIAGADFVGTHNNQSIGKMVEHLCRTGAPPVFLSMPSVTSNARERKAAYEIKMLEMGLQPTYVQPASSAQPWQFEAFGLETMDNHFSRQKHISDTILCANDRIAIGAIRAANKHGLLGLHSRGDQQDLRIAGHDDHPLSRYMSPAITTIAQDVNGISQDAIRLLLARIRKECDGRDKILLKNAVLKTREST